MGDGQKALFAVFDGHGGCEVAKWCEKHYQLILYQSKAVQSEKSTEEWLRQSFLKVDEHLTSSQGK